MHFKRGHRFSTPSTGAKAMKKKKTKHEITHEDIRKALEKFNKAGGLIKKLPDEHTPSRVIASEKGIYEDVEEFLAKVDLTG